MKHKMSRSLRIYSSLIIFAILSFSLIVTGLMALSLYYIGRPNTSLANPFVLVIWIYGVSVVISTAITFFVGRWILSPILKISSASALIAKGNFDIHLDEDSKIEEVQITFQNFNNMVRELGAIETLRNDFIANVSHEFKTPLNAIEGYATLLQDPELSDAERREYIDKILFSTGRLSTLTGNILLLSKVENQSIPNEKFPYQLDEQLRQCLVMLEPKWGEKDLELDVELDEVCINGCESLLMQVWTNLIGNAIKFSPAGSRISIRLSDDRNGSATVLVRDEGIGMSRETMLHIFVKFYQGDTSRRSEGNGLGLALVKKIVDLCGGTISVTSAEGEGSTFRVTLPLS